MAYERYDACMYGNLILCDINSLNVCHYLIFMFMNILTISVWINSNNN